MNKLDLIYAQRMLEGAGFEVKRPIPGLGVDAVGPFILLDQIGPTNIAPGKAVGAPTHPHVGIETFTYILDGEGMHLDSLGNQAVTRAGEAQWMRSGRGIIHDEGPTERFLKEGGKSHAVQLWINMPGETKQATPEYRSFTADDFTVTKTESASLKVIAGSVNGLTGPLITFAKPTLAVGEISQGGSLSLDIETGIESALYLMTGLAEVNGQSVSAETLAVMPQETTHITVSSSSGVTFLLLGGPRMTDRLVRQGPFVANSNEEMHKAIVDFQQGKFGSINK